MADFYSVMKEHVRHIIMYENTCHYLSYRVEIVLMQKWSREVTRSIVHEVQKMKLFSIILNCMPDIIQQEQMSVIVEIFSIHEAEVKVKEHFL